MNTMDILNCSIDPWEILGVNRDADDASIEKAWKSLSSGRRNDERLRQAYQFIATEESRIQWELLSPGRQDNLDSIIEDLPYRPKYSGPGIWYRTIEEQLIDEEA